MKRDKRERCRASAEANQQRRQELRQRAQATETQRQARVKEVLSRRREEPHEKWLLSKLRSAIKKAPKLAQRRYGPGLRAIEKRPWLRPVNAWKPKGKAGDTQFRSLVRHLTARYALPEFLYSVFWEEDQKGVALFWHLADGGSLWKGLGGGVCRPILPVPLTKKMCHLFLQSTKEHTIYTAVRHAQVSAFGGSRRIAESICSTRMGTQFVEDESFWQTVIQWTCNQGMLAPSQVPHIFDWIRNRLFAARRDGTEFSMKGRTAVSVLREVERWHEELARERKIKGTQYLPCGLKDLSVTRRVKIGEGVYDEEKWTIAEVLTSKELREEGRTLRHCVVSYGPEIEQGRVSIWSLQVDGHRKVTIEVINARKQIVQMGGKYNRNPTPLEMKYINQFAAANDLTKSKWA